MRRRSSPTPWPVPALARLLLLVLASGLLLAGCTSPGQPEDATTGGSGLPTVAVVDLPAEAADTVALIAADGPFPFEQDGVTFHNREGLLPEQPDGYYREFTVITPGSPDRGARRIVAGGGGELYYTDDHYASFREVTQ